MEFVVSVGRYKSKQYQGWINCLLIGTSSDDVDYILAVDRGRKTSRGYKKVPDSDVLNWERHGGFHVTGDGAAVFNTGSIAVLPQKGPRP